MLGQGGGSKEGREAKNLSHKPMLPKDDNGELEGRG